MLKPLASSCSCHKPDLLEWRQHAACRVPGAGVEGAEDCASTEPKLKPVRTELAGAAGVPPNKAGVDAAGAPNARGEDAAAAAVAAMPKDRGAGVEAGVEAAVEGRGVLMARAKGADAAAEAVLAGVLDSVPGN